jgi:hypothetical protein
VLEEEAMAQTEYTLEEIARRAQEIYQRDIRDRVMPQHKGKFLVVDIESGDYEIGTDDLQAEDALRARRPEGVFFLLRVGYTGVYKIGGRLREEGE